MSYFERFYLVLSRKKWEETIYTHYFKISEHWDSKDPKSFQRDYNIYLQRKKNQIGFRHFIRILSAKKHWSNVFKSSE